MTCDIYKQQTSLASCVMCAVKRGHREVVRTLTADLRVPVNITNKQGLSPLQTTEDPDIIQLLQSEQKRYTLHGECIFEPTSSNNDIIQASSPPVLTLSRPYQTTCL